MSFFLLIKPFAFCRHFLLQAALFPAQNQPQASKARGESHHHRTTCEQCSLCSCDGYFKHSYPCVCVCVFQVHRGDESVPDGSDGYSASGSLPRQPSGTLCSLFRKRLHVSRLYGWMHGVAWALRLHLRERQDDYVFFSELLGLSIPLLFMLCETTAQISLEGRFLNTSIVLE